MIFVRRYRSLLLFAAFLTFASIMVVRQVVQNHSRHVELREALILLESRGYVPHAKRLYERLVKEMGTLSDSALLDDFQRTLTVVDPANPNPDSMIWKYHWTVSNELEKRASKTLERALNLAQES